MTETTDTAEATHKALDAFWAEMKHPNPVMLGILGSALGRFVPMTPQPDEKANAIWFFTRTTLELAQDATTQIRANMIVISHDKTLQAGVTGTMFAVQDVATAKLFWNPIVAAWYPEGINDPELTMLRFTPENAEIWHSTANPIRFAFEIGRAHFTSTAPDVGNKMKVTLAPPGN